MHWNKERLGASHEMCVHEEGRNGAIGTVLAMEAREKARVLIMPIKQDPRTLNSNSQRNSEIPFPSATSSRTNVHRPEIFITPSQVYSKRSLSSLIQVLLLKNSFSIKEASKQCVRQICFRIHAPTPPSEELFPARSSSSVVGCV